MNVGSFTAAGTEVLLSDLVLSVLAGGKVGGGSGGVPEHGMNDSTAERGWSEDNPLMAC